MGSIDRGFEIALELAPGEQIRWRGPAMFRVGRSWVGGRIYLSGERLFFCPGVVVRRRYGVLRVPLSEVTDVEVIDRRLALNAVAEGGLKPRLKVATRGGDEHFFTMQRFHKRAGELQELLSAESSGRAPQSS
jgi:hypothetical protein